MRSIFDGAAFSAAGGALKTCFFGPEDASADRHCETTTTTSCGDDGDRDCPGVCTDTGDGEIACGEDHGSGDGACSGHGTCDREAGEKCVYADGRDASGLSPFFLDHFPFLKATDGDEAAAFTTTKHVRKHAATRIIICSKLTVLSYPCRVCDDENEKESMFVSMRD